MALQLSWAVVLIGFAYGLVTEGPGPIRQRLLRGLLLGALVAGGLLLVGSVVGFVRLAGFDPPLFALNFVVLAAAFLIGLLFGEEVSRRRPTGS